jgi:hypothetical protein
MKEVINHLKSPLVKSLLVLVFIFNIFTICSVSTAHLSDVRVCSSINSDSECESDASSFPSSVATLYCSAKLKNAPEKTKVIFTWKFEDEVIGKADVESGSAVVYSYYKSPGFMKPGNYSVTVKIDTDNAEPVTKKFTLTE